MGVGGHDHQDGARDPGVRHLREDGDDVGRAEWFHHLSFLLKESSSHLKLATALNYLQKLAIAFKYYSRFLASTLTMSVLKVHSFKLCARLYQFRALKGLVSNLDA